MQFRKRRVIVAKKDSAVIDSRIVDSHAIKKMIATKGYAILFNAYQEIKEDAMSNLLNEKHELSELVLKQKIYNQIVEWIKIPELIMATGEGAIEENRVSELVKDHAIKEDVPFIGRR